MACDDKVKNTRWLKLSAITHTPWAHSHTHFSSCFLPFFSPLVFSRAGHRLLVINKENDIVQSGLPAGTDLGGSTNSLV